MSDCLYAADQDHTPISLYFLSSPLSPPPPPPNPNPIIPQPTPLPSPPPTPTHTALKSSANRLSCTKLFASITEAGIAEYYSIRHNSPIESKVSNSMQAGHRLSDQTANSLRIRSRLTTALKHGNAAGRYSTDCMVGRKIRQPFITLVSLSHGNGTAGTSESLPPPPLPPPPNRAPAPSTRLSRGDGEPLSLSLSLSLSHPPPPLSLPHGRGLDVKRPCVYSTTLVK